MHRVPPHYQYYSTSFFFYCWFRIAWLDIFRFRHSIYDLPFLCAFSMFVVCFVFVRIGKNSYKLCAVTASYVNINFHTIRGALGMTAWPIVHLTSTNLFLLLLWQKIRCTMYFVRLEPIRIRLDANDFRTSNTFFSMLLQLIRCA